MVPLPRSPQELSPQGHTPSLDAGGEHSLALKSNGTVWGWGENGAGQLGTGTATSGSSVPVQVANLTSATAVGAGNIFSIALKSDGTAWGWGYNQ